MVASPNRFARIYAHLVILLGELVWHGVSVRSLTPVHPTTTRRPGCAPGTGRHLRGRAGEDGERAWRGRCFAPAPGGARLAHPSQLTRWLARSYRYKLKRPVIGYVSEAPMSRDRYIGPLTLNPAR